MTPTCPIHGKPLVVFCPACRGSRGGAAGSPKQTRQRQRAAKQPRPSRRKER